MNRKKISLFVLILMTAFTVGAQNSKDVNGDGVVNVTDVVDVINHILTSSENPNPSANQNSKDVNGDGVVNVTDVVDVINYILKPSEDPNPSANQTFTVNGVSFEMVKVEGGTFTMGATAEQGSDADSDESPTHQVTLSSYMIGKTEVTQELWQAVMGSNPSNFSGTNLPVEKVSWEDCQTFITKLNNLTGKNFRLPTEAEWEYAARGGNKSQGYKYSGSNTIDDVAWYSSNSSSKTHSVATKAPNELGIYDMSGNVWEWCSDRYGDYSSSAQTNPFGPASGSDRVRRGGCWGTTARSCRVSYRYGNSPDETGNYIGLRLALDVNQTFSVNGVSFDMIAVEGGTFTMGATAEQGSDADSDESPTHQVTLSSYMIGKTEVTQELWQAVMGSNPSNFSGTNLPVEQVSWEDCQTFITKLNNLTGKKFRLPTEAEWEYAARGGNKSQGYKYSGSNTIGDVAWYYSNSSSKTHPVATKAPNELGIYDMSGNVYEWCSDRYSSSYYSSSSQINPTGPTSGSYRVYRGGCWGTSARSCRVSYRDCGTPTRRRDNLGLRLALDATETFTVNGVSFEMVKVEGGTFTMGATAEQGSDADSDEYPAHQVTLSSYYIGKTEVTQELWQAVMGSNPSNFSGTNLPVEKVSWEDCQTFITKLNNLTGKKFRLPTEAEWEYAARGGNKSQGYKYSGSNTLSNVAWYYSNSSSKTHPVATKAPNELGIYDMSGNVYEWCRDWYSSSYYSSSSQINPTGPTSGAYRVHRGGGWYSSEWFCRVSGRYDCDPTLRNSGLGLRLCLPE